MFLKRAFAALAAGFGVLTAAGTAFADYPRPWEINLQQAASPVMERIVQFHDELLVIITAIAVFVLGLLVYVIIRFHASRNPTPSRTSHNTLLEVIWTVVPVLILVFIAIPSFKLLYYEGILPPAGLTLKVTGHQWYWSYAYPDNDKLNYDSLVACRTEKECAGVKGPTGKPAIRLLDVDNPVVVPVNTVVRVKITSDDVIHSWSVPSLGVKIDAVPGRLNEIWFKVDKPGVYYGQCSQLCGMDHGFMPIAVQAVPKDQFDTWVQAEKKREQESSHNGDGDGTLRVARAGN